MHMPTCIFTYGYGHNQCFRTKLMMYLEQTVTFKLIATYLLMQLGINVSQIGKSHC